jgi:ubiquitin-small subunit ribosomal protein S27Ae
MHTQLIIKILSVKISMNILVRGLENQITSKQVAFDTKAEDLLAQIAAENCLEIGTFKIVCDGTEVCEELTLAENGLTAGSIVDLALEVDGGKKKKKKKVYKTEKKKKHQHINNKLRILSYYNIKSDGTAEPVKLKSPFSPENQVLYMANHWNRHYCGRSHVTLIKDKPDAIKKKVVKTAEETKAADAKKAAPAKGKKKK